MHQDEQTAEFLAGVRTIAVVGLSGDPAKDSHQVASYLQSQGYEIVPVNPHVRTVLGRPAIGSLREARDRIDLVDVFRRAEAVADIVADAVAIGARGIWLQPGITAPPAEREAREAGLFVASGRCLMVEHRRLLAHAQC